MTNKEIRVSNQLWQRVVPHQTVIHITPESMDTVIDQIQDLTRKDERERVIGEIEKRINGYMFKATTDNAEKAINGHYANILAELNQLK